MTDIPSMEEGFRDREKGRKPNPPKYGFDTTNDMQDVYHDMGTSAGERAAEAVHRALTSLPAKAASGAGILSAGLEWAYDPITVMSTEMAEAGFTIAVAGAAYNVADYIGVQDGIREGYERAKKHFQGEGYAELDWVEEELEEIVEDEEELERIQAGLEGETEVSDPEDFTVDGDVEFYDSKDQIKSVEHV